MVNNILLVEASDAIRELERVIKGFALIQNCDEAVLVREDIKQLRKHLAAWIKKNGEV